MNAMIAIPAGRPGPRPGGTTAAGRPGALAPGRRAARAGLAPPRWTALACVVAITALGVVGCSHDETRQPGAGAVPADTPARLTPDRPSRSRRRVPPVDSGPMTATPAELDELRASIEVPVQGVVPADLHDTYTEARTGHVHQALDILAPRGTPVVSAADGRLLKLHESVAGGHMVYAADRTDRFILMYAHLDRYAAGLRNGMPLKRGQLLGYVGTSGNAPTGTPHLHFAIARGQPRVAWWRGTPVDPFPLLLPAAR